MIPLVLFLCKSCVCCHCMCFTVKVVSCVDTIVSDKKNDSHCINLGMRFWTPIAALGKGMGGWMGWSSLCCYLTICKHSSKGCSAYGHEACKPMSARPFIVIKCLFIESSITVASGDGLPPTCPHDYSLILHVLRYLFQEVALMSYCVKGVGFQWRLSHIRAIVYCTFPSHCHLLYW